MLLRPYQNEAADCIDLEWQDHTSTLLVLPPLDRGEARYLRDERLGMLCGDEDPTEEEVEIVARQLFPPPPQPDLI